MSKFKAGDKVRVISVVDSNGDTRADWPSALGKVFTVSHVDGKGGCYPVWLKDGPCFEERMLAAAHLSKAEKAIAAKEAELARLKAAAAKRAEDAAKRKAKVELAKNLAALSKGGKRAAAFLRSDPSFFGCQRDSVINLVAAITGDDNAKFRKALA